MNNNTAVTISGSGKITAVINGRVYTIDQSHPNYTKALDSVKAQDWESFLDHVDITRKVQDYILNNDVKIVDGIITYKGEAVHNLLTKRVISFMQQDLPFKPLLNFLYNLMENPSHRAVNELYDFLDVSELPITEDGHFLAFKNVKADYTDIHSGTFDNSIGKVCEMPRYKVDEDKDRTCSTGLHFCSIAYLPNFSDSNGGHTMILKINPKDVVSIPADYNNTKGRCCRYEVIGEYTENWREKIGRGENGFDSDLYSSDGGEYEDDDDDTEYCANCQTILDNWDKNSEMLFNTCYDDKYSGCYGGGCAGKTTLTDEDIVGNDGNDGCCGGQCGCDNHNTTTNNSVGVKPDGSLFYNLRDKFGTFVKKNVG